MLRTKSRHVFYQFEVGSGSVEKWTGSSFLWNISLDGTWTYVAQEVEPEKEKVATPVLEDAESLLYQIKDLGLVIKMLYASASV